MTRIAGPGQGVLALVCPRWNDAPLMLTLVSALRGNKVNLGRIGAVVAGAALAVSIGSAAGASSITIKVSPSSGLSNGQTIKVAGKGLPVTTNGKTNAFFISECTSAVSGQLSTADESHCSVTGAKAIKVSKKGVFATTFKVATGTIGDGTCSASSPCVIGVGDAGGQGSVATITFK